MADEVVGAALERFSALSAASIVRKSPDWNGAPAERRGVFWLIGCDVKKDRFRERPVGLINRTPTESFHGF